MTAELRPASQPGDIYIPGWHDVITLGHREPITPAERDELSRARAENRAPRLAPARLAEIERIRDTARAMRESQIPEWRKQLVMFATTLDNIQDLSATMLWLTGPTLRLLGTRGKVVHETWALSNDAINYAQTWLRSPLPGARMGRGPELTNILKRARALRQNPAAAARAVDPKSIGRVDALRPGRSLKSKWERQRRARATATIAKWGRLGHAALWLREKTPRLIEAAQSTDFLFGAGLQLGVVFGAIEENTWRTFRKLPHIAAGASLLAQAELARLRGLPTAHITDALLENQRQAEQIGPTLIDAAIAYAGPILQRFGELNPFRLALRTARRIALDNPLYTPEEHVLATHLHNQALYTLGTVAGPQLDDVNLDRLAFGAALPDLITDPLIRYALETEGCYFTPTGHPFPACDPTPVTELDELRGLDDAYARALPAWLPEHNTHELANLQHVLIEDSADADAPAFTGSADDYSIDFDALDQIPYAMADHGIALPLEFTEADTAQYLAAIESAHLASPDTWRDADIVELTEDYLAARGYLAPHLLALADLHDEALDLPTIDEPDAS